MIAGVLRRSLERGRTEIDRLGYAGIAGIALIVFAAIYWVMTLRPHAAELGALHADADVLQQRLRAAQNVAQSGKPGPAEQLAAFYAFFPQPATWPEWLGKINKAAVAKGVQLQSGEYKLERAAGAKLVRYQLTLPVQGSYGQVRAFIAEVLAQVPAAVLEEVSLKRERADSPQLEARIRFALFLGGA